MPKRGQLVLVSAAIGATIIAAIGAAGCGGGGSEASFTGTWRTSAIGSVSNGASLVSCPGTVIVDGEEISCGNDDRLTITSERLRADGIEEGVANRAEGNYTRNGNRVDVRIDRIASDTNGNGTYEADETLELTQPLELTLGIQELTDDRMRLSFTQEGTTYAAQFSRL